MNKRWIACLVIVLVVSSSINTAIALQSSDVTVTATLSTYNVSPGEGITVTITIQNNGATQFSIIRVGMHADFMGQDNSGNDLFLGPPSLEDATLGSSPYRASFLVEVPEGTALGTQNFYIGVDAQDSSGEYYSWNSQSSAFQIADASTTIMPTATPTSTATTNPAPTAPPTSTTTQTTFTVGNTSYTLFSNDTVVITAIIAIVIIVLIICTTAVILLTHKKHQPN